MEIENLNPRRAGFADAVLGREPNNPFKEKHQFKLAEDYTLGYLKGKDKMRVEQIINGNNTTQRSEK